MSAAAAMASPTGARSVGGSVIGKSGVCTSRPASRSGGRYVSRAEKSNLYWCSLGGAAQHGVAGAVAIHHTVPPAIARFLATLDDMALAGDAILGRNQLSTASRGGHGPASSRSRALRDLPRRDRSVHRWKRTAAVR